MPPPTPTPLASPPTPSPSTPSHDSRFSSPYPQFHPRDSSAGANPSTSTSTSTAGGAEGWHFPGPSSRYHTRYRPKQRRDIKSHYTPHAPFLSTEQRALHRAQSAQVVRKSGAGGGGLPSPPGSECGPSPLTRKSMNGMAGLMTPARKGSLPLEGLTRLHDSPFSDYFTDDARSVDTSLPGREHSALSEGTQALLVRLGRLQSRLMRAGENEAGEVLRVVEGKVEEMERELAGLQDPHARRPSGEEVLEDSGLFMDDDEPEDATPGLADGALGLGLDPMQPTTHPASPSESSRDQDDSRPRDQSTEQAHLGTQPSDQSAEQAQLDTQLASAHRILTAVSQARAELRARHTELVSLNDTHVSQLADHEREIATLRSANERLRSDLGFSHSELLFLKLQLKALEVEVAGLDKRDAALAGISAEGRAAIQRVRRGQVMEEMERWRADWRDVEGGLKRRLSAYGVLSADQRDRVLEHELGVEEGEEVGEWRLETVKEGWEGKVRSLTIRRVEGEGEGEASSQRDSKTVDQACPTRDPQSSSSAATATISLPTPPTYTSTGTQPPLLPSAPANLAHKGSQTPPPPPPHELSSDSDAAAPKSHPAYVDEATQTALAAAHLVPPTYYAPDAYGVEGSGEAVTELEGYLIGDEAEEEEEEEGAVTIPASLPESVSRAEVAEQEVERRVGNGKAVRKSAWAELWEGLGQLAGVRGGEEEEEDE